MISFDWLSKWNEYSPSKIALKEFETGKTLTYRELNNVSSRLAGMLVDGYKLTHGDRFMALAENCIEYFIFFFAAQKAGLILIPVNFRLTSPEIDFLIRDSEPKVIITEKKYADKFNGCPSARQVKHILELEEIGALLYENKEIECGFEGRLPLSEEDPIFILYTSGTTGIPKGALYTHKMLAWNSFNTTMRLDITSDERSVSCMPQFHTGGWNVIPTPFLHRGAYLCITKKFEPEAILQSLQDEKATMFVAVPTMLQLMAQSPLFEKADLSAMKYFVIGGEPMPLPLIEKWHGKGIPIRQGYGLTEAGPSVTSLHQDDAIRKMGSIGKLNFYFDSKIVDEDGIEVAPGTVGEFLLKGPSVTPGYWNNREATECALKDGWFYTGDLVRRDKEGYIYVVDRKKNMYISGGENVYPAEVEKLLYSHPDVKEAAVIGVPDEKWGESGKAFIVAGKETSSEEILKYCDGKIARYKIPKYVQFIEQLPKNDTGKINRKELLQIHLSNINN
jgi:fatty-acyl-CoA synthase